MPEDSTPDAGPDPRPDSQPVPAAEPSKRPRRTLALEAWLLPLVLGCLAIIVQIVVDVPRAEMLEREVKKKKPPRRTRLKRPASAKAKSKAKKPSGFEPRPAKQLAELREKWAERPLEDEPSNKEFRRRHEAVLRSAVTRARTVILGERRVTPMQIRPRCHTVRCALELCGEQDMIGAIAELLPTVTVLDEPLWHELREVEPTREPIERQTKDKQVCRRWIVSFTVDGPSLKDLRLAEEAGSEG